MAVSREDVRKIAILARLRLSDEEVERFRAQLSSILEHIDALAEVDLEAGDAAGGEAAAMVEWQAPLRADDVGIDNARPDALDRPLTELAPAFEQGFFTVPRLSALDGSGEAEGVPPEAAPGSNSEDTGS